MIFSFVLCSNCISGHSQSRAERDCGHCAQLGLKIYLACSSKDTILRHLFRHWLHDEYMLKASLSFRLWWIIHDWLIQCGFQLYNAFWLCWAFAAIVMWFCNVYYTFSGQSDLYDFSWFVSQPTVHHGYFQHKQCAAWLKYHFLSNPLLWCTRTWLPLRDSGCQTYEVWSQRRCELNLDLNWWLNTSVWCSDDLGRMCKSYDELPYVAVLSSHYDKAAVTPTTTYQRLDQVLNANSWTCRY